MKRDSITIGLRRPSARPTVQSVCHQAASLEVSFQVAARMKSRVTARESTIITILFNNTQELVVGRAIIINSYLHLIYNSFPYYHEV